MNKTVLFIAFCLSFIITLLGAVLKIVHASGADTFLLAGVVASYACLLVALSDIFFSKKYNKREKVFWLIAILLTGWLALMLYAVFVLVRARNHTGPEENFRAT